MRKHRKINALLILALMLILTTNTAAEELTFEEIINTGYDNNYELQQKEEEINTAERSIVAIEAGFNWQLSLSGSQLYGTDLDLDIDEESFTDISLNSSKDFISGLNINSKLSLTETEPYDFENLDTKYSLSVDVSKKLYPLIPTEQEKEYIKARNTLLVLQAEYDWQKTGKKIDWLENSLELKRLAEKREVEAKNLQINIQQLKETREQQEIGEAGQEQLLLARINVKEAELAKFETDSAYTQQLAAFKQELGIGGEQEIDFLAASVVSKELKKQVASWDYQARDREQLVTEAKESNVQLLGIKKNRDYAGKEYYWQQLTDNVHLDAISSYEHSSDEEDWRIGLMLSYDILDGGLKDVKQDEKAAKVESLEREYENTLEEVKLQLDSQINAIKTAELQVSTTRMKLEKAEMEEELAGIRLKKGGITEQEYQQSKIALLKARIEHSSALDNLFISKLRLMYQLGEY